MTYLLVLDDVWDEAFIKHVRCNNMRGVILLTSRKSVCNPVADGVTCSTMEPLADQDTHSAAKELMMNVLQHAYEARGEKFSHDDIKVRLCNQVMVPPSDV